MKWLLKRFNYTRQLERRVRELDQEGRTLDLIVDVQSEIIDEYREIETQFTKLTLDEAHELFSACVDYQRALGMAGAADPVQHRIIPIMEKYGITIDRNTLADDVGTEELKAIIEDLNEAAGGPKSKARIKAESEEIDLYADPE